MIPQDNDSTLFDIELVNQPSKTYKLSSENIIGFCDNLDAVKQTIYFILNTERYQYSIYSWDYGIELKDLIGASYAYVVPELERRITEALTQDDRINNVFDFNFDKKKNTLVVSFTVETEFGNLKATKEVIL
ncbi:DUF2634 domain-containing protein [Romboutsia sp. MSSM.1001216sp_RTP31141st1_G3_RTP31141_220114]|uniref:DUF2634 domain-containing protein n=1 Tax=unclassified Romboutsia TaxID=2626894 RepID=UPI0031B5EF6B